MKVLDVEFAGPLQVEAIGEASWRLLSDFPAAIQTDESVRVLTVPKGFETDLASVHRLPGMFMLFGGRARKAAVLHDYLYFLHEGEREMADEVFFKAMAHDEGWFTRVAMWLGARVGGWAIWQRRPVPELPA